MTDLHHVEAYRYHYTSREPKFRPVCEARYMGDHERKRALRGPLVTCLWCMALL